MLFIAVNSCGDSNDSSEPSMAKNTKERLVGSWKRVSDYPSSSNLWYIRFVKGGNGYIGSSSDSKIDIKWDFNEQTQTLIFYTENGYYSYCWEIEFFDNGDFLGKANTARAIYTPLHLITN